MKTVEAQAYLIQEENPLKQIERAGRICYKSEEKITKDSSKKFYDGLVKRGHHAMLEHANFVFMIPSNYVNWKITSNKFLNWTHTYDKSTGDYRFIVSGNLRTLNEDNNKYTEKLLQCLIHNGYDSSLAYSRVLSKSLWTDIVLIDTEELRNKYLITDEEKLTHIYTTFHCITDRGVTHEMVRHRIANFAQESSRYVNYVKSGECIFYLPYFLQDKNYNMTKDRKWEDGEYEETYKVWESQMLSAEKAYLTLVDKFPPQAARAVLPTCTKTEIIMTANGKEWQHFFNLRYKGTTGRPHPDMKLLASKMFHLYIENVLPSKIILSE